MNLPPTSAELSPLKRAVIAIDDLRSRLTAAETARHEPIAVVGLGCRFPGAESPQAFWRLLRDGQDAVREVPPDRWDVDAFYDPDPDAPGKIASRWGGFVDGVDGFDPQLFGIAPREAIGMDPQQRLLLEVAWEALEYAGIAPDSLSGSRTGVFVAISTNDYAGLQLEARGLAGIDAYYASGVAHSVASGRLSYVLGLQGPSLSVDTACSSSLVAIHLAIQSLRGGESRMAVAGGVNLILTPDVSVMLSRYHMLATDGRCKTFDARADGFVRGEGCGLVVLKRVSDAMADGDVVLAVIRGSAVNQDGPSSGLTAPSGPAQEAVIREALADGGVAPAEVDYVEAHGTGTSLGDPIEVQALAAVLGQQRSPERPLAIGSVKTNIGHLEMAAGIAGFIKAVMVLQHGEIPPHLHLGERNPHIDWSHLPVVVPTARTPFEPAAGRLRIAGVSSFGFSGTNAHLVLQAAQSQTPAPQAPSEAPRTGLLALSARSRPALDALADRYARYLQAHPRVDLQRVTRTANAGRARLAERVAIAADSPAELQARLAGVARGETPPGVVRGQAAERPRVAFLFTGQGAQYAAMGRGLYDTSPVFRVALDRCAVLLDAHLDRPLLELLFSDQTDALNQTGATQPALFALQFALVEMWRAIGITPAVVLGHSVGAYAAACAAGVFSVEDGLRLVAARGRLMQALSSGGGMAAVFTTADQVAAAIAPFADQLSIAAFNGPAHVVVSGDAQALAAASAELRRSGVRVTPLLASHAFHSQLVEPMLDAFEAVASTVAFADPRLRFISDTTGQATVGEIASPRYWRAHARQAIRFEDALRSLGSLGCDALLEIGPHPVLVGLAAEMAPLSGDTAPMLLPSLRRGRDDWPTLLGTVGALFTHGAAINWDAVDSSSRRLSGLPTYPFQRQRYWVASANHRPVSALPADAHPLLGRRIRSALTALQFESELSPERIAYLDDHRVLGRHLLPATGYVEMALAAGRVAFGDRPLVLEDMLIRAPLSVVRHESRTTQVILTPATDDAGSVEMYSASEGAETWLLHAAASLRSAETPASTPVVLAAIQARCPLQVTAAEHYAGLAERGLDFGPSLQGVQQLFVGEGEALGRICLPAAQAGELHRYALHPALLDACLQVLGAAHVDRSATFLPVAIDRVSVLGHPEAHVWSHVRLRNLEPGSTADMRVADVLVFDDRGSLLVDVHGIHFRRVPTEPDDPTDRWLYEIAWRPQPALPEAEDSPIAFDAHAVAEAARSAADAEVPNLEYHALERQIEALSAAYVRLALRELGWRPRPGDAVSAQRLAVELRVAERYHLLMGRLLAILGEAGTLHERSGGGWEVMDIPVDQDVQARTADLARAHPEASAELGLLRRCGEGLAHVLSGTGDPLQLLFPGGSLAEAELLYAGSPTALAANALVQQAASAALAALPAKRHLRVLEVGAGTGGTTSFILPLLPAERSRYVFTDVSPLFVARAREKFQRFPCVEYQTFDLEADPASQGFSDASFDVVVAANVVHATVDLSESLGRLKRLLAPGGLLLLLEMTRPQALVDISFGLTPGWWRFADRDLRPSYPLLTAERWPDLLEQLGFEHAAAIPEAAVGRSHQALVVASAPRGLVSGEASQGAAWLVLADESGVGQHLVRGLRARGHRCVLARSAPDCAADGVDTWRVRADQTADWEHLLTDAASHWLGVVHLASLDGGDGQRHRCGSALALVQALVKLRHAPRLWFVTRQSQPVTAATDLDPLQATLWGFGAVVAQEHPELRCVRVDLDGGPPDAAARTLMPEILTPDPEDQIGIRDGRRYAARLTRYRPMRGSGEPRAVRAAGRGNLDKLELQPIVRRAPGPGEVEIEVRAAGLNFRDVLFTLGLDFQDVSGGGSALGGECAGEVVRVGPGVDLFRVGDAVIALAPASLATHVSASADLVVPKPDSLSWEQAAAIPIASITAELALMQVGRLRAGERVLIHAAAGGVGLAAVRVAQRAGAEIFATAGSPAKRAFLRAQGIEHVMDSRSTAFSTEVRARTSGRGVDMVLNSLTGEFVTAGLECLADGGRFLEIGKRDQLSTDTIASLGRSIRYSVIDWGEQARDTPAVIGGLLRELIDRADLTPLPVRAFPLEHAAEAFRYMAQARHIGKVVLTLLPPAGDVHIRDDGTYLVTGGFTGLGLRAAEWLAEQGARHLVLVGRRGAVGASQIALDAMRHTGVSVTALAADVSQINDVARVFAEMEGLPTLRGVVHAAGMLDDATLSNLDWPRFQRVLAPKVGGAGHLDHFTRSLPLDFFVLFSSLASLVGAPGQANHAAANAYLDALAHARRRRGQAALSINWGAWSEIGSAAERGVDRRVAHDGVGVINPEDGLHVLGRLLQRAPAQVGVLPAEPAALVRQLALGSPRTLLAELGAEPSGTRASAPAGRSLHSELANASSSRRREQLLGYVRDHAGRVLGMASADLPDRVPLGDLGLDSLMAVELRNSLGGSLDLQRPLPATLVFDYPTIAGIADYLARDVFDDSPTPSERPEVLELATTARHPDAERALVAIEDLSDEDVERLLAERASAGA